jgi:hypothetical protein
MLGLIAIADAPRASTLEVQETVDLRDRKAGRPFGDGERERVVGAALDSGGDPQNLALGRPLGRNDVDHPGLAHGQRAGLVEDHDIELGRFLERPGVLEQDPVGRPETGADHDRHRRGEPQRVRAGDHEDGDRERQREQQRLSQPPVPDDEGGDPDHDRRKHQNLGGPVGEKLGRRARVLRLLHQLDDLRQSRVGAYPGRSVAQRPALVDGRADDAVAYLLGDRHRLSGQHGFVDGRLALDDLAVHGNFVARTQDDDVADQHVGSRNLDLLSVAQDHGLRRSEIEERADRRRRARTRTHLQPMTEQDEDEKHGRRLEELLAPEEERAADAEQVAGADAQDDEHRHVEDAVPECAPCGDREGPDRIEDCGAGEEEQEDVRVHVGRRRDPRLSHAHRRGREQRNGEDQADQEPVPHVADHVPHVHAGAVAHLVRHRVLRDSPSRLVPRGVAAVSVMQMGGRPNRRGLGMRRSNDGAVGCA